MSTKVKRGLGLLAVAVIAFLVAVGLSGAWSAGEPWRLVGQLVQLVALVVAVAGLLGGLVLIAWGLLATRESGRPASDRQD